VEAERSQKVDVVSNDTQIVNVEPSKRLKMDELHQDTLWFLVFVIIMIISVVRDVSYQFPRIVLLDVIIFLTILV
jgi:hypothetical protein